MLLPIRFRPFVKRAPHHVRSRLVRPFARLLTVALLAFTGCATESIEPVNSPIRRMSRYGGGPPLPAPVRTIVIDPGHGGHDPGTSHYGLKEKNLVLDMARRLRTHLQQAGFTVVMTRDSDQFIPLSKRPGSANRMGADLFVSVHVNANRSSRISGIEVYYPRVSTVSGSAPWPPAVVTSEVGVPSTAVKQVMWDLVLGNARFQSRRLASSICRSMRTELQVPCRAVKPARFVVLREAWMPSVLVETGYVTNQTEASRLASSAYRAAAAKSIADGIITYVRSMGAEHI